MRRAKSCRIQKEISPCNYRKIVLCGKPSLKRFKEFAFVWSVNKDDNIHESEVQIDYRETQIKTINLETSFILVLDQTFFCW